MRSPIRRGSVPWRLLRRIPLARRLRLWLLQRRRHRRQMAEPTAIVYVDGFNFYSLCLKGHPDAKWLDLVALCDQLLPGLRVIKVRFFTAEIRALQGTDPRAPSRQQAYLRALAQSERLEIHLGKFQHAKRWMPSVPITLDAQKRLVTVKVRKVQEKQSDVNLAAWMMLDAGRHAADTYVLLSSDSDFAGLLRTVHDELGSTTGLISPIDSVTGELREAGPRYVRRVRRGALLSSQLPNVVQDGQGTIKRPDQWA